MGPNSATGGVPMRYGHVHTTLNILFSLLGQLALVSKVLCILEAICHTHDLRAAKIFFSVAIIVRRVTDSLELRPIVHSVDLDW
jgi:hypothetical protein